MDHDQEQGLTPDGPLMTMSHSFLHDEMLKLSIPGPSRDPTYYIGDGNTVLLVDNTLFKVRGSALSVARRRGPDVRRAGASVGAYERQVRV